MAIERIIMAEGIPAPESASAGPQIGPAGTEGQAVSPQSREAQVFANAALKEEERLQAAKELLGGEFTPEQEKAIKTAHEIGAGEPGKEGQAGVYNYTQAQLREKAEILKKAGFTPAQRRVLLEAGVAGILPRGQFRGFNPDDYKGFSKLETIAKQIKDTGDQERADEIFLNRTSARIEQLLDDGKVDEAKAQMLLGELESWRIKSAAPELLRPTGDPLLTPEDKLKIDRRIEREGNSDFSVAKAYYDHWLEQDQTDPQVIARIDERRRDIEDLYNQAKGNGVLEDVKQKAREFYNSVKATKRHEKWGRDKQQVIDQAKDPRGYLEFFWDNSPELKNLEPKFKGLARYVWDGIVAEVDREVNKGKVPSSNVAAVEQFEEIKELRKAARLTEKKYATHEYYGSRNYELTAENADELVPAVLDFVRDQIAEISDTDAQSAGQAINEIRQRGLQILETCRVRLETEEDPSIVETHPVFLRAKAFVEAVSDVLGNEKVLKKGGEDISAQHAERFASNYIAHHDAIYLENPKVALISHLLSHGLGGNDWNTYWMGHNLRTEKPDEGETENYRRRIEKEIVEYAATHQIFLTEDDFKDRDEYSFDDPIEKKLLDPTGAERVIFEASLRAQGKSQGDINQALQRYDNRIEFFRRMKFRLDEKDPDFAGKTEDEKRHVIRTRIYGQMQQNVDGFLAGETTKAWAAAHSAWMANDQKKHDQIIWGWVKAYNQYRINLRLPRWHPSGWDRVRMRIDRPTKVLDRFLTDKEFEDMFEPVSEKDLIERKNQNINDARFGFQLARSYQIFNLEDAMLGGIRTRIVNPANGEYEGELKRVFDIVQGRLEAAIEAEEKELESAKTDAEAEMKAAAGDPKQVREIQESLDKKLLNSQFIATHALKRAKFVEGKLPVWSQSLMDNSTINFFANALAAYGVNVAYRKPISHNSKDELYAVLERGRRALKQAYDDAASEFMEGKYTVDQLDENGKVVKRQDGKKDENGNPNEPAVSYMSGKGIRERKRIVNTGGVREHLRIVDTRFETSTSGGVAAPELIYTCADLGYYPPFVRLGVKDLKGYHGYIKGLDEVQSHTQYVFNTMDPVNAAREQGAAYKARRFLVGGSVGEGKSVPGFLNEPFHGAFKVADFLQKEIQHLKSYNMTSTYEYMLLMQQYRDSGLKYTEFVATWSGKLDGRQLRGRDLERLRQMSYQDFGKMTKTMTDELYTTVYGVLDYFQDHLKALKPVEAARGGRAFRTDVYDNTLKWYAFRRAMRKSMQDDPTEGFVLRLGYSGEVTSEIVINMMETVLQDADYLILRSFELDGLVKQGQNILYAVLTDDEKKTFVIPDDEKLWPNQRIEIREALDLIKREGLLEFMKEEGYELGGIKRLGDKKPPRVQDVEKNATKLISAAARDYLAEHPI